MSVNERGCYVICCSVWGQVGSVCVWGWNIHDHLECIVNVNGYMWERWKWRGEMKRGTRKKQAERQIFSTSALLHLSVCLFSTSPSFCSSASTPPSLLPPSTCSNPSSPHLSPALLPPSHFCFLSPSLPKRLDEGLSTVMACVSFTWQALVCDLGVTKRAVSMGYNPVARCTQKHTLWTLTVWEIILSLSLWG